MRWAASRTARLIAVILFLVTSLMSLRWYGAVEHAAAQDQGDVLIQDKFEDNTSNHWKFGLTSDNTTMDIADNALTINVTKELNANWVTPDKMVPKDVDVSVDVNIPDITAKDKWFASIIVRADKREKTTAFYEFDILSVGSDPEWAFVTYKNAGKTPKDDWKTVESGKLKNFKLTKAHTLLVSARGNDFTFSVDGTEVGTFTDDTINVDKDETYMGLLAGTFKGQQDLTVNFSNLVVTAPASANGNTSDNNTSDSVLLKDSFNDNSNEWYTGKDENGNIKISGNELIMTVAKGMESGRLRWVAPTASTADLPEDIDATVTAQVNESEVDGAWYYGVGLRYFKSSKGVSSLYMFLIFDDGKWAFLRLEGDNREYVVKPTAIKNFKANDANKLNVTAVGDQFTFYLNNKKLGTAQDDKLMGQKSYAIALAAGTSDVDTTLITHFTDLLVMKPE